MSIRSFSNCKLAPIRPHDEECIYLFKLLLSCNVTCLTPLPGPIAPLFVWVGIWLPKIQRKERFAKNSLKWGGMSKRGKCRERWGVWEMFDVQKVALRKQEWNENSLIKKIQIISTFSKFSKDSEFEFISKYYKRWSIFLNNKVLKVLPYCVSTSQLAKLRYKDFIIT